MSDEVAALKSQVETLNKRLEVFETHFGFKYKPPIDPTIPHEFNFTRLEHRFDKYKLRWLGQLRVSIREEYGRLSQQANLQQLMDFGRESGAGAMIRYRTPQEAIDDTPRFYAVRYTGEDECRRDLELFEGFMPGIDPRQASEHPQVQLARRKAELAVRERHTRELLAAVNPQEPTVMARLRQAIIDFIARSKSRQPPETPTSIMQEIGRGG